MRNLYYILRMSSLARKQGCVFGILLLAAFACEGWAAETYVPSQPDPVLEPWRWRVFSELKGLGLRCMAEGHDRTLFFGVDHGVRSYDGIEWKIYTPDDGLISAPVNVVSVGRDGTMYAGSDMGISRFNEGKWKRFFPPEGEFPWPIDQIIEDVDGNVWAATAWGALRVNEEGATLYTTREMSVAVRSQAPYVELSLVPDEVTPRHLWGPGVGMKLAKGGYIGVPRGSTAMVVWGLTPGGPAELAGLRVGDHVQTVEGLIPSLPHLTLSGSEGTSVSMEVTRPGVPEPFSVTVSRAAVKGFAGEFSIADVFEDRDGVLWFGLSWGGEIVRYDSRSNPPEWRMFTAKDGLGQGDKPRITQTRDGTIWTISNHFLAGVNKFDGQTWTEIHLNEFGGNDINTSILETHDGTLWIGGHLGRLQVLRNGSWTVHTPSETLVSEARIITLLETSDQALWIGGLGQEVSRFDHGASRWTTFENLDFQCDTPDGTLWFRSGANSVVRQRSIGQVGDEWTRYTVQDGLMEQPARILATRKGVLWAVGQHEGVAATAQFDGERWSLKSHPMLSGIGEDGVIEAADGTFWFGSSVHREIERGLLGGILHYDANSENPEDAWTHLSPPEAPAYAYGIAQTADGTVWVGGSGLLSYDGKTWTHIEEPGGVTSWIHGLLGTADGGLWAGTRSYGLFHFDGHHWTQYGVEEGLANNRVKAIHHAIDGSLWAVTDKGISRFDGQSWITQALPLDLQEQPRNLRQAADGALWINDFSVQSSGSSSWTLRYSPEVDPPQTEILPGIAQSLDVVSQPGNTTLAWRGTDRWQLTADEELQYSWRINDGSWTAFSPEVTKIFFALDSGKYTFEVKARDRDFNEDLTPAIIQFSVLPPVWGQPWFICLVGVFFVAISIQTVRVIRRDRRLLESNAGLQEKTSNLEKANRQVRQANQLKSQFLANMSHELRTPLNAILGFAQLMARDRAFPSDHRENLTVINRSGEHLLTLINDVLEMSKIEAGQTALNENGFDLYDLLETVEGMFRLRAEEKNLEFVFSREDNLPQYIHADQQKLRQVLINLLGNAVKFTEEGSVALRSRFENGSSSPRLFFEVEDTGEGIDPKERNVMFEAFVQTTSGKRAQEGTGLGLPISQQFVRMMGGVIRVQTEVERGSIFSFDIQVRLADATEARIERPKRRVIGLEPNQPVYRILIVEDRVENRKLLFQLLAPLGFEVREAENGLQSVEIWREWKPHLIWMDMRMPVMDGYEATRRIKKTTQGQATVVIALTASAFEEQSSMILSEGCDDLLRKPFKEEEILGAMTKHLGVRFVFESEDALSVPVKPRTTGKLSPDALSGLPAEWIEQLHEAATQADGEMVLALLKQIETEHEELAGDIKHLVDEFRFDHILNLSKPRQNG